MPRHRSALLRSLVSMLVIASLAGCGEHRITAPEAPTPDVQMSAVTVPPPTGTFTQVSSGNEFSCALRTDGSLACWGDNTSGRATPPAGIFVQVSSGREHSCAVASDHGVACWGFNFNGEATAPAGTFSQVSAGSYYSCAVRTDGTIACWGQNDRGQASPPPGTFTQVSAGGPGRSCAIRPDGTLACWGGTSAVPATAPAGTFTQLTAGANHSCAQRTDGTWICWGQNAYGQPSPLPGAFTQVSAGLDFTCGVMASGPVMPAGYVSCSGRNDVGQATPPIARQFTQVAAGWFHACGITLSQGLACWGSLVVQPSNQPPIVTTGGPFVLNEGDPFLLGFRATDPDLDPMIFSWDFGDGHSGAGLPVPLGYSYADDGVYTISFTADDRRGGITTVMTTATVANVAPSIPAGGLTGPTAPIQLVAGSASAAIVLRFGDPAGVHDTYSARIDCGNGTTLAPTGVTSPVTVSCGYTAAGSYAVSATVSDEDGGTSATAVFQPVVVESPAWTGGFTTGSGSFVSPPDACPSRCGVVETTKGYFTFDARLRRGETGAPAGSVKFWLQNRRVELKSTSLTALVVVGRRAQLSGTGLLKGVAGHTFRITAVDGGEGGADLLRIEIWSADGTLVYDTQWRAPADVAPAIGLTSGYVVVRR